MADSHLQIELLTPDGNRFELFLKSERNYLGLLIVFINGIQLRVGSFCRQAFIVGQEVSIKFLRFIHQRIFLLFHELAANRAKGVNKAKFYRIRLLVKVFGQDHIDLILAYVNGERLVIIVKIDVLIGIQILALKKLAWISASFYKLRKSCSKHRNVINKVIY